MDYGLDPQPIERHIYLLSSTPVKQGVFGLAILRAYRTTKLSAPISIVSILQRQ